MRFFFCLLCLSMAFTPSAPGEVNAASLETVTLQLRWRHQFQFAGYYAAVEQGYYRDAGLQVHLKEGAPGLRPGQEVVTGKAEYGIASAELLLQRLQGDPVVALAVIFQHSASALLVRAEAGLKSPQDLAGKRVMMREGIDSAELLTMFVNEGVAIDTLEKQAISYNIGDLLDGKTDAYHVYITDQPYILAKKKVPYVLMRPITYGIDFYGDTLFTSEAELQQHPDRVRAFREASLAGWRYAMEHVDETIELIVRNYNHSATRKQLDFAPEEMRNHLRWESNMMRRLLHPELIEIGHMNPGRWRHIAETYASLGLGPEEYTLDGFLYDPQPAPDYGGLYRALALLGIAVAGALLYVMVLLVFNRRLKRAVAERTLELAEANQELQEHRERLEERIEERTHALTAARHEVQTLSGLLPICANCKKIRDEKGVWSPLEEYISGRSEAHFSHSICPACQQDLYPEFEKGSGESV